MSDPVEIAVLIVCYNGREHIGQCLQSVLDSDDGGIVRHVVVVDNASTDGSAEMVQRQYPQVDLLRSEKNLGFAGGNNAGWEYAARKYPGIDYVALLNQDTIVQSGWLGPLIVHLDHHPVVGAVQAKLMLYPQTDRINTLGNRSHYLGFGFTTEYGRIDTGQRPRPGAIDFPSGAAAVVRAETIGRAGLFDDLFFLYLEDADLGWKLRQMGYRIETVGASTVWHKYSFQNDYRFYYYLERNRWYLLATYYKTATLLLLLPAFAAMEVGQIYFAVRKGVLGQKLRAMGFFLKCGNISRLLRRRRDAQRRRNIGDRQFTASFTGDIHFPELNSAILKRVGNPLLGAYWSLARRLIWW